MWLRYAFRVYPDAVQRVALAKAFGCARVVYNDALRAREDARAAGRAVPTMGALSKQVITEAKRTEERAWLGEVSVVVVLQQSLRDLQAAYRSFAEGLKGTRPRVGAPRFKSRKDSRQSVRFTTNARWSITDQGKLVLPKVGAVPVRWSRGLPCEPSSVTVLKDAVGRYFASFVVDTSDQPLPETDCDVGIDLGLAHFAVARRRRAPPFFRKASSGRETVGVRPVPTRPPRNRPSSDQSSSPSTGLAGTAYERIRKLKKAQRALSRTQRGSANRAKARTKLARAHARVGDCRREFHHQLSTKIISDNQAVFVEDLAVKGLGRTRMAKSVHDAGWATFVHMLQYKATRYGRTFYKVDRFLASSQTCSICYMVDGPKPLHIRTWTCQGCGTTHDRDVTASNIVLAAGRKLARAREAES